MGNSRLLFYHYKNIAYFAILWNFTWKLSQWMFMMCMESAVSYRQRQFIISFPFLRRSLWTKCSPYWVSWNPAQEDFGHHVPVDITSHSDHRTQTVLCLPIFYFFSFPLGNVDNYVLELQFSTSRGTNGVMKCCLLIYILKCMILQTEDTFT